MSDAWTYSIPLTLSTSSFRGARQAKRGVVELKFLGPCPMRLAESLRASSDVKTIGTRELTAEAFEFAGFSRGPTAPAAAPAPSVTAADPKFPPDDRGEDGGDENAIPTAESLGGGDAATLDPEAASRKAAAEENRAKSVGLSDVTFRIADSRDNDAGPKLTTTIRFAVELDPDPEGRDGGFPEDVTAEVRRVTNCKGVLNIRIKAHPQGELFPDDKGGKRKGKGKGGKGAETAPTPAPAGDAPAAQGGEAPAAQADTPAAPAPAADAPAGEPTFDLVTAIDGVAFKATRAQIVAGVNVLRKAKGLNPIPEAVAPAVDFLTDEEVQAVYEITELPPDVQTPTPAPTVPTAAEAAASGPVRKRRGAAARAQAR